MNNIIIISNKKNWMEQTAKDQLEKVSKLNGVVKVVGLPDLHAGKTPIGMAMLSKGRLYPHLMGNDIGCGMGLYESGVKLKNYKSTKWINRLSNIRDLSDLWIENPYEEESPIKDLGTIGGGNHFAEFQCIHSIENETLFQKLPISKERVLLLIHSGSRGYGQHILNQYDAQEGLSDTSDEALRYLSEHANALLWAKRNRELTAIKLLRHLGVNDTAKAIIDCCHNFLENKEDGWIHRKGATSATDGVVVIPGSRGSLTYLCFPKKDTEKSLYSLSHGAGRKWARSVCKSRINTKYDRDSIRGTKWKSTVICHDTNLLFQEAPEAYKNINDVVDSLLEYDLMEVVATLKPLITFKC